MTRLATYTVNGTNLSVDMKAPLAEAQRLITADTLTKAIVLTPIRGYGSYSTNASSGSTDTGSGHVDFDAEGMTDAQAQRCVTYLRRVGFLAYFRPRSWWSSWLKRMRTPGWQRHIHCLLDDSADLSTAAKAQVAEWKAGGDGLVGPELDNGDRTIVGRTWTQYLAWLAAVRAAAARAVKVRALQVALRQTPDGRWGAVTERVLSRTKAVRQGGRVTFSSYALVYRRELQAAWGTTPDGAWGPYTLVANVSVVKNIQKVLGVPVDGLWGPVTDKAYLALRAQAYKP
ncbi:hypothetical protein GCM10027053_52110 [Intrasporangium mesophilum]